MSLRPGATTREDIVAEAMKRCDDHDLDFPVGCCLHVLVDDGNIGDGTAAFCLDWAAKAAAADSFEHSSCLRLAQLLVTLSEDERASALRMHWCAACEGYNWTGDGGTCNQCDAVITDREA